MAERKIKRRKPAAARRARYLSVRVTDSEMDALRKAAGYLPPASWARAKLMEAIEGALGKPPSRKGGQ